MLRIARFLPIALLAVLVLTGAGCSRAQKAAAEPVQLTIWRVFDQDETFVGLMQAYRKAHPNVSIIYKTLRYEEFPTELVRAIAKGEGPDIFSIRNTWVGEYQDLMAPLPDTLTIPFVEVKGALKKETYITLKTEKTLNQRDLRNQFADVVAKDVVRAYQPDPGKTPEQRIFALPLALDTLALYFNRDLFNAAGIAEPPTTWEEFSEDVVKLTKVDAQGNLLQAGATIGTAKNIDRAPDILSALMMQSGTAMTNDRGTNATFGQPLGSDRFPALEALRFYTDFANPVKETYTWNDDQPNAIDAFVSGKAAFFFGYAYHYDTIKSRAPKLNFEVAPLPQLGGGEVVNMANYWVEGVSKASPDADWAWDFIQFATRKENVTSYLTAAKKPAALRALIADQLEDESLATFASQVLTSKNWYRGKDADAMEQALRDLITHSVNTGQFEQALIQAQNKVSQTL